MSQNKPCPFCGSTNIEELGYEYFAAIKCWDCFAEGPQVLREDFPSIGEAEAEAWRLWDQRQACSEPRTHSVQTKRA